MTWLLWSGSMAGCPTPTGFAARAGVEATHALTFKLDHSLGADHSRRSAGGIRN